jgi:histidine triad (HIT) family protein
MPSLFSRIVNGEIPCYKITETEDYLAFLDVFPLKRGHVLVIPKKEVDYVFNLDDETFVALMNFSKKIALAMQKAISCNRISVHIVGLEVPHAHVHLIPINTTNDCNFANEKLKFTQEEFNETASLIAANL